MSLFESSGKAALVSAAEVDNRPVLRHKYRGMPVFNMWLPAYHCASVTYTDPLRLHRHTTGTAARHWTPTTCVRSSSASPTAQQQSATSKANGSSVTNSPATTISNLHRSIRLPISHLFEPRSPLLTTSGPSEQTDLLLHQYHHDSPKMSWAGMASVVPPFSYAMADWEARADEMHPQGSRKM